MTKVFAISMMKDEEDVAFHTVMHLGEEGLDGIIVADNMSTDGTRSGLERARDYLKGKCEVIILDDKEVGYYQSRKMTDLAHMAHREFGANWIIPFDADEIWYSRQHHLGTYLRELDDDIWAINVPLFNHFATAVDGESGSPFETMMWRQPEAGALPKVCFKWRKDVSIHQGNHGVDYSRGTPGRILNGTVELRHFPYRSFEQFVRKARNGAKAYQATDLPANAGAHWRQYGDIIEKWGEDVFRREVWERYFWFYSPVDEGMIQDPAPFRRWA